MKTSLVSCLVVTLVALVGCSTDSGNTPKATTTADKEQPAEPVKTVVNKPIIGEADDTFSLSMPSESVALTQGDEQSVRIGINRGETFREEVAIDVSGLPEGVTLATASPVIQHGSQDATLMLKAAEDAALGDFTVKLTGHTSSGAADFTKEFKMSVTPK